MKIAFTDIKAGMTAAEEQAARRKLGDGEKIDNRLYFDLDTVLNAFPFLKNPFEQQKQIAEGNFKKANDLESQLKNARQALSDSRAEVGRLTKLQTDKGELQNAFNELQNEKTELQKRFDKLQVSNTELQNEKTELQKRFDKLQVSNTELQNGKTELQKRFDELQVSNTELQNGKTELQKRFDELQDSNTELQTDFEELKTGKSKSKSKSKIIEKLLFTVLLIAGITTAFISFNEISRIQTEGQHIIILLSLLFGSMMMISTFYTNHLKRWQHYGLLAFFLFAEFASGILYFDVLETTVPILIFIKVIFSLFVPVANLILSNVIYHLRSEENIYQ